MGRNSLKVKESLKYYAKKRNHFLFFVIVAIIIMISGYFGLIAMGVAHDLILTIALVLLIPFTIYVIWYRQRYNYYIMQLEYFKMLADEQSPIQLTKQIFTNSFISHFVNDGFLKGYEDKQFILYYRFTKKIKEIVKSGQVLEVIVLAKDEKGDFYNDKLDKAIRQLYLNYKDEKKVRKQIVLQFKKYQSLDDDAIDDANKIINFSAANNYLIHITIAYDAKTNQIYYLRPKKRYPNKFYYYAVTQINKYTWVREDNHEQK